MTPALSVADAPFDFAQFLLERDAITAQQAADVRHRARNERVPIGQLLLQSNYLTMKEVMRVLSLQAERPTEKFGQIALGEGYLTLRQLEDALNLQRVTRQHMIEIVHRMGIFDPRTFIELTIAYVGLLEMTMSVG